MQLDTLLHASFKLLDDAVTDWSTLVDRLEELKKDAEDGLHQAANKANWAGMNAQVSKEFIGKTAGEFADAHTQAKTIHSILSDTRGELKGYHRQLTEAIDRGRKKSLKVIGYEGGFTVTSDVPPEGRAKADSDNQERHHRTSRRSPRDPGQGLPERRLGQHRPQSHRRPEHAGFLGRQLFRPGFRGRSRQGGQGTGEAREEGPRRPDGQGLRQTQRRTQEVRQRRPLRRNVRDDPRSEEDS